MFIIAVVQRRCPNLYPAIPLNVSCPPGSSITLLLPGEPSPGQRKGTTSQYGSAPPIVVLAVVLSVAILVVGCALRGTSRAKMGADIESLDILCTVVVHGIRVWR